MFLEIVHKLFVSKGHFLICNIKKGREGRRLSFFSNKMIEFTSSRIKRPLIESARAETFNQHHLDIILMLTTCTQEYQLRRF